MSEEKNRKPRLTEAIILTSSLISISHSIKVFTTRWQSVRAKLEELYSTLAAVDNCESGENLSLSIAVDSILSTLKRCDADLARPCLDSTFTSGKLRMQSDLDRLAAGLDAHIKGLSDIYAVGLREQAHAIVVSRPSISASKDDVRFYVSDLLSRLKIGCADMKKRALDSFNDVVREDERCVRVAVEIDGFVNCLVNFLDSPEIEIQEGACESASLIAGFQACKGALIGAGVIGPLIRVLESGTELGKENAARCLMKVTENSDNAWSISAHGGVPALLKICGGKTKTSTELIVLACGVLKNLVGVEEIKRFMVEEGAVSELIELAGSNEESTLICSLDLLQSMAYRDEPVRECIIREGGIRAFVRVLDPKSTSSTKVREVAFKGILSICLSSEDSICLLLSFSFLDHVLHFLLHGDLPVQELALKASFGLCGASEDAKKAMGDAGFMPVLVKFLDSKLFEVREMAAETLSSLLVVSKNRKRFAQSEESVGVLMRMLDPEVANAGNKKLLLSILMSLASSNSARKKIVSSGYLRNIEALAEAEVSDAKKIVRKLSSNRFRSIFSGMLWHS